MTCKFSFIFLTKTDSASSLNSSEKYEAIHDKSSGSTENREEDAIKVPYARRRLEDTAMGVKQHTIE